MSLYMPDVPLHTARPGRVSSRNRDRKHQALPNIQSAAQDDDNKKVELTPEELAILRKDVSLLTKLSARSQAAAAPAPAPAADPTHDAQSAAQDDDNKKVELTPEELAILRKDVSLLTKLSARSQAATAPAPALAADPTHDAQSAALAAAVLPHDDAGTHRPVVDAAPDAASSPAEAAPVGKTLADGQLLKILLKRGPKGLGLRIDETNTVIAMDPGGAADKQGLLREGDTIVSCDGIPLHGRMMQDVMDRSKTSFSLGVRRLTPVESSPPPVEKPVEESRRVVTPARLPATLPELTNSADNMPSTPPPLRAGCRARLVDLGARADLNGEEVLVVRWYAPSSRWVCQRVISAESAPPWPGEFLRVASDKLRPSTIALHDALRTRSAEKPPPPSAVDAVASADAARRYSDAMLSHILSFVRDIVDLAHVAAVDTSFARAAAGALSAACAERFARGMARSPAAIELAYEFAPNILPLIRARLASLDQKVRPHGGSVRALLVDEPVLHIGQATKCGDLSCAYRVVQMMASHMVGHDKYTWPGARATFLDVEEMRESPRAVPSVPRLQCTLEAAWREQYDPVGGAQLNFKTTSNGLSASASKSHGSVGGAAGSTSRPRGGASTDDPIPTDDCVLDNGGAPVHVPNLRMLGAADMWALMRYTGLGAQLNDFIDGEEGEATASEVLFEWVWEYLNRHQRPADRMEHVKRSAVAPIYLQWAGHAVCIVGACRRQFHGSSPIERHLLIFNPERKTPELHAALSKPEPEVPEPHPAWWGMIAWSAIKALRGPRILLDEAVAQSAGMPGMSEKGPGNENGPYQTMHVPPGWVMKKSERRNIRSPEDACTQHVGNNAPMVLSQMQAQMMQQAHMAQQAQVH